VVQKGCVSEQARGDGGVKVLKRNHTNVYNMPVGSHMTPIPADCARDGARCNTKNLLT
jgi:hypothetical protein